MANLKVNGFIVDGGFNPETPFESVGLLVSENYPKGSVWTLELSKVEIGNKTVKEIQSAVSKKYGGSGVSPELRILGKLSDATIYLVDCHIHSVLAANDSAASPYSKALIKRHEAQYGKDSWLKVVAFAEKWAGGRIAGDIPMPIDVMELEEVAGEIIKLGGFVLAEITKQKGGA